jgi:8-oxo-dGTP pyrophosphatase MutT (NUDIX family)
MRIAERDGKIVVVDDDGVVKAAFGWGSRAHRLVLASRYMARGLSPAAGADSNAVDPTLGPSPLDGLSDRQLALREAYGQIGDMHGQFNQTAGADGGAYLPAARNPFRAQGLVCSNCTFWRPDIDLTTGKPGTTGFCDVVSGDVEPDAVCKLWVIPADLVREAAEWVPPWVKKKDEDDKEDAATEPGAPDLADPVAIKAAGLVVRAADTGRILALQRALNPITCPGCDAKVMWDEQDGCWLHSDGSINCWDESGTVCSDHLAVPYDRNAGAWEFPGGKVDPGETPFDAAVREWAEEVGTALPGDATPSGGWASGVYQGFLLDVPVEAGVAINTPLADRTIDNPDDLSETVAWWSPVDLRDLPNLRAELRYSIETWWPLLAPSDDDAGGVGEEATVDGPVVAAGGGVASGMGVRDDNRCPAVAIARATGLPSNFTVEVGGKTIVTTMAELGLGYWDSTPPGGGEFMSWLQARYVGGERPNRNGALWTTSDLQSGFPTVAHGPLNWLHEERRIIGSIVDARFMAGTGTTGQTVAAETTDPHIAVLAGAWRWIYPHEVYSMQAAEESGLLAVSMECVADEVQCAGDSGCGQSFPYDRFVAGDSCSHLKQRGGVKRMVRPTFLGAGVIVPPARPGWADADARMMAVEMAESAFVQAGEPDVSASQWEMLMSQIVRFATSEG